MGEYDATMDTKRVNSPQHSRGLRFRKLDLHVHSPKSSDFEDKAVTADALILAAKTKGLEGIAITDHNSAAMIDEAQLAGKRHSLVVFPGAEITCSGGKAGIHIIALFDPSCNRQHVEGLLSELGFHPEEYGDTNAIVEKNPLEVANTIVRRGGLAILAHANSSRGALKEMTGQQRINLVQCPAVIGVEATDCQHESKKESGKRLLDLLDGTDDAYRRKLAVYQASDNPAGDGKHGTSGIGQRCSYFKLDRLNLEGLRQCLDDPDVRIRQDYEFVKRVYPRIKQMRINGGFLDGSTAEFHEGLNSVLGAKGAGKSLMVEFLRFALDQAAENHETRADHDGKLLERLEDYGTIEVTLVDETGKEFTLKRTYNPAEGNPYTDGDHDDIAQVFPVLFLSQNEIIKIAESEEEQIGFIDRFFDFRSYRAEVRQLEGILERLDSELAEAFRASKEEKEIKKRLAVRKADIVKLDAALKNPVFDQYSKVETKDRVLRAQLEFDKTCLRKLEAALRDPLNVSAPEVPKALKEDPAVRRGLDRNAQARKVVEDGLERMKEDLEKTISEGKREYERWSPTFAKCKKDYDEAIQKSGGDYRALAQKRARSVKELESLNTQHARVREKSQAVKEIASRRTEVLEQIRGAYEGYTAERKERCRRIEAESGGRLKVKIHEATNIDEFRRRLTELKRGSYLRDVEIEKICKTLKSAEFMRGIVRYSLSGNAAHLDSLADAAGIEKSRMQTLAEFLSSEYQYENLLALEYKALPQDRPEIRYDIGEGTFEPLSSLSIGQKCTAMLLIALGEGTMPIVVDQPEDSLDLRTIWEDICSKVRRGKDNRQFIFTTHNSSVAVASDTDKFIVVEGGASSGRVVFSGSMDHKPISEEALKYLEGGPDTYKAKYRKYRGERITK